MNPELKLIYEAFKELAKNGNNASEILTKLKEKFEDISFVHLSFEERLEVECLNAIISLFLAFGGPRLEHLHQKSRKNNIHGFSKLTRSMPYVSRWVIF